LGGTPDGNRLAHNSQQHKKGRTQCICQRTPVARETEDPEQLSPRAFWQGHRKGSFLTQ
jgi:hypothetical protein